MVREKEVDDGDEDDMDEGEEVDSDAYDEEGVEDEETKERNPKRRPQRRRRRRRRQTRRTWESGSKVLCLNLDDGAFINHGGQDEANIGLGYHHDYDYNYDYGDGSEKKHSLEFYALRDIEEGEELLYDYDSTPWSLAEMDLNV